MDKKFGRIFLLAAAFMLFGGAILWAAEPIYIGVSGPLTGNYAEYGQNWKKAMDLGLGWINAAGGVNGRPIELIYTDSKSDPKESGRIGSTLPHRFPSQVRPGEHLVFRNHRNPGRRRTLHGPLRSPGSGKEEDRRPLY